MAYKFLSTILGIDANFTGNVGVGTTTPGAKLDVSTNAGRLRITQNIVGNTLNGLEFAAYNGTVLGGVLFNQSTGEIRLNTISSYFPTIYSNGAEVVRIPTSGNVLIGTTTDAGYKLYVNGSGTFVGELRLTGNLATGGNRNYILGSSGDFEVTTNTVVKFRNYYNSGDVYFLLDYSNGGRATFSGAGATGYRLATSGSVTPSSAVARGAYFNNTLVASANNDVLVGLDITPTFTNGAFTGVKNVGLRSTVADAIEAVRFTATSGTLRVTPYLSSTYGVYVSTLNAAESAQIPLSLSSNKFIFENGNVLIGTTTDAGYKLDVNGTTRFQGSSLVTVGASTSAASLFNVNITQTGPNALSTTPKGIVVSGTYTDTNTANNTFFSSLLSVEAAITSTTSTFSGGARSLINLSPSMSSVGRDLNTSTKVVDVSPSFTFRNVNNITGFYYNPTFTLSGSNNTHRAIETVTGDIYFASTSGNVGIGTAPTSTYKLDVNGTGRFTGTTNQITAYYDASNYMQLQHNSISVANTALLFNVNSAERMRLLSTGNLLIGTTTDAGFKLDVNGTQRVQYGTVERGAIFTHSNGTYAEIVLGNGSQAGTGVVEIHRNGTSAISIRSTTILFNPSRLATSSTFFVTGPYGGSSLGTSVRLASNTIDQGVYTATSGTQSTVVIGNSGNEIWSPSSGNATYNLFSILPSINTSGTYSGIVRGFYYSPTLTSIIGVTHRAIETVTGDVIFGSTSGNVGIGTTTPGGKLHVIGAVGNGTKITTSGYSNWGSIVSFNNDSAGGLFGLDIQAYSDAGGNRIINIVGNNTTGINFPSGVSVSSWSLYGCYYNSFWQDAVLYLRNTTGGTGGFKFTSVVTGVLMSILENGRVLIGTTTDTGQKLQVTGTTKISSLGGGGTQMVVADNTGVLSTQAIPSIPTKSFGAWQEDTTQTAASSNTGYGVKFSTPDISGYGVNVINDPFGDATYIEMVNNGVYNIQFSLQLQNTDGQIKDVTIWLRKNGNTSLDDIPATAGFVSVPNSHGGTPGTIIAAWNYFVEAAAGDFYQLVWSTSDHTRVSIEFYPAGSPPPSAASAILTVNQVN